MSLLPLTQYITYWTVLSVDGNMSITYNPGVVIKSRWVKKDGYVVDSKGKKQNTTHIIYANSVIPKRSRVFLGEATDLTVPEANAKTVLDITENPSITNLVKIIL